MAQQYPAMVFRCPFEAPYGEHHAGISAHPTTRRNAADRVLGQFLILRSTAIVPRRAGESHPRGLSSVDLPVLCSTNPAAVVKGVAATIKYTTALRWSHHAPQGAQTPGCRRRRCAEGDRQESRFAVSRPSRSFHAVVC